MRSKEVRDTKVWVRSFAAAQAHVGAENHFARKKKGKAAAETLMQIAEIQVASSKGHFSGVIEEQEPDRTDNSPIEFRLHKK
jgi:hypothetical protein